MRRLTSLKAFFLAAGLLAGGPALAAGEGVEVPNTRFSFDGIFGHFDRASAQRGFQVYKEVCANCHSMHLMSYRNLRELGLSDAEVRAIAATVQVQDGPNDEGEMFERPGRPSDRFRSPFANERAARAANNGALPPDLSVIVKARENGADYIHALLTGYAEPPAGVTLMPGMNYNKYFPGHQIAMAPPLTGEGQVEFHDGTKATVDQMVNDVVQFLAWTAEPELEQRKAMGVKIIVFLVILAGLAYSVKRKVWADVH
ncbi:cytochrome c1 [Siccirubricoccus sp. KC 17139]|uniref:Cytochrome c1 n=1 Tax=Siccirubricoccus soli TaxID=2899147 RepID=A0ABT1D723_9PROT|nr:cytochrome c1 [Siccirubricoccus soli]MCO6417679.1 cytochrome c1 [Siccirubricoccus soli]MCP2683814.1 cytochrome c1 [Siccirubricoccus soli]